MKQLGLLVSTIATGVFLMTGCAPVDDDEAVEPGEPVGSAEAAVSGTVLLKASTNDKCMRIEDASTTSGAKVDTTTCHYYTDNQNWTVTDSSPTSTQILRFRNVNSGLCLHAVGNTIWTLNPRTGISTKTCPDTRLEARTCADTDRQRFQLQWEDSGGYVLYDRETWCIIRESADNLGLTDGPMVRWTFL